MILYFKDHSELRDLIAVNAPRALEIGVIGLYVDQSGGAYITDSQKHGPFHPSWFWPQACWLRQFLEENYPEVFL